MKLRLNDDDDDDDESNYLTIYKNIVRTTGVEFLSSGLSLMFGKV